MLWLQLKSEGFMSSIKYCTSTDTESSDGHCMTRAIAFSEFCTYHHIKDLEAKLKIAVELLGLSSEKLALYRSQHSGEYIGGTEYQGLQDSINGFIKQQAGDEE